ncbi:MAG: hypothetical protein QXD23_00720 [Candidatus Micrarchaeaceae archaeon]
MLNSKNKIKKEIRAQSATEYLLTYGWSILIIAITILALFELGYFNIGSTNFNSECLAEVGFLCTNPILNSTGNLTLTVGNNGGQNLIITGLGCSNSSSIPTIFSPVLFTIGQNQEKQLTFECKLNSQSLGSTFKGYLWLKSSTGEVQQLGSTSAKVSTTSSISTSGNNGQGLLLITNTKGGNSGEGNVVEINANNGTLINSINFYVSPFDNPETIKLSPNGKYFYVSNFYGGSSNNGNILIINTSTNQVVNSISSSSFYYPSGISFIQNGKYAYIPNYEGLSFGNNLGNVLIINTSTNQVINSISSSDFAYPDDISSSPTGGYSYLLNSYGGSSNNGNILIINTSTNQIIGGISSNLFDYPIDVSFSPDGKFAYVLNNKGSNNGNILIINTSTNQIKGSFLNNITFTNPTAMQVNGNYIYIMDDQKLIIANLTSKKLMYNLSLTNNYQIYYLDNLSGPYLRLYYPFFGLYILNNYAYITDSDGGSYTNGNVTIINLENNKTIGTIGPINQPVNPSTIFVDGDTAYIIASYLLYKINLLTNQVNNIQGPFSYITSATPYNQSIYMTNIVGSSLNANILIMNPSTDQITGSIQSPNFYDPIDIEFSGIYGYVVNNLGRTSGQGNITIFNTQNNQVVGEINSNSIVYPTSLYISGNTGYLANNGYLNNDANILLINLTNNQIINGIQIPGNSISSITGSGKYIYVTQAYSNDIKIIDTQNNTVINSITYNYLYYPSSITTV